MGNSLAIYYFLEAEYFKNCERWFSAKEISKNINLSIDRTRKHLSLLVFQGEIVTRIEGWHNLYKFKR